MANVQFRCECNVFKVNTCNLILDFDLNSEKPCEKYVFVKNISETPQVLLIKSPSTHYFLLDYSIPQGYILPGKDARIKVYLQSRLQLKQYRDRISFSCTKGCAIVVKLLANPGKSVVNIPSLINFGQVPLGKVATARITLPPFERKTPFIVISNTCSSELKIKPMKGTIKDVPVTIEFSYTPRAYITVNFPIHIYLPSLTSWPYFVTLTADTKPGIHKEIIETHINYLANEKEKPKPKTKEIPVPQALPQDVSLVESKKKDLSWGHHHTNLFLLEKDKNVCPHGMKIDINGRPWSYQQEFKAKQQQIFMNKVEELRKKLQFASSSKKELIIDQNTNCHFAYEDYWQGKEDEVEYNDTIFHSFHPRRIEGRILTSGIPDLTLEFSGKLDNPWFVRYVRLNKFIDAARRICVQGRLLKRLQILKGQIEDQNKNWAPHVCCVSCYVTYVQWMHGKKKSMTFGIPMIWREPTDHKVTKEDITELERSFMSI